MSKRRPLYQDPEDSYERIAAKKTCFAPVSESDGHKGKNSPRPRNAFSANKRPLDRDDSKKTNRQEFSTSEGASDATRQGSYGLSSTSKGNSLESLASTIITSRRRDVSAEDLLPDGLSVHWYSSEGRKDDKASLHGRSKDCSPAVESSVVEFCRTFLASLKQNEPSDVSIPVRENAEEVGAGIIGEPVSLGQQQGRGETTAVTCSFIGRDAEPSTTDLVHPDLPVSPYSLIQPLLSIVSLRIVYPCVLPLCLLHSDRSTSLRIPLPLPAVAVLRV